MRNLKRALSLALASIMVLGMMVVGAGAVSYDDLTDKDKIVNQEAVQMLVELGVIDGKEDGSYDPEGIITRAEMSKLICVVLNGGNDPQLGETPVVSYTDTVGTWAAPYIEYCTTLGIVAGKGGGMFDPSATVTGSEAAKMLLVALGYNAEFESMIGANWEVATNVLANKNSLYKGLSITTSEGLTRDSAAQMVYNALNAKMVEYDYSVIPSNGSVSAIAKANPYEDDRTLLSAEFNAVKVEGIVIANEVSNLNSSSASLDTGKTKVLVTNDEDQKEFTGSPVFTTSTTMDQLGRSVILYVKKNNNATKAQVLGNVITSDDNKVVVDYTKDSIKDVADDNNMDIVSGTQVAENYGKLQKLSAYSDPKTAGVEKILIDNDNDGEVDYVLVNTYVFGKVTTYTTSGDGNIAVSAGKSDALSKDDKDDVVGFDDVAKNDYVMAIEIGGKLYVEKAETVTGELEAYKGTDPATKLTVDGTDYNVSNVPGYSGGADDIKLAAEKDFGSNNLDNEITFYLDKGGYIVAAGESTENAYNYALVLAKGTSVDERVKVALPDGTTKAYDLNDSGNGRSLSEINVGDVYAYSLNSSNEIKLTKPTGYTMGDAETNASFSKGKTTIYTGLDDAKSALGYATKNTAFFYIENTVDPDEGSINKVNVYTGYGKAPSVKSTDEKAAQVRLFTTGTGDAKRVVAVLFIGEGITTANVSDVLYISSTGTSTSNYTNATAFIAGSSEPTKIKMDDNYGKGAYLYSINSDGIYELKDVPTGNLMEPKDNADKDNQHQVMAANSDTFVVKNTTTNDKTELAVTSKTLLVDHSEYLSDPVAELGAGPDEDDVLSYVVYNDDKEALLVVVNNPEKKTADKDHDVDGVEMGRLSDAADVNKALKDDNVIITGDYTPDATITIPADATLKIEGDLDASGVKVNNEGTLIVEGTYTTGKDIIGEVTAEEIVIIGDVTISGDVTTTDLNDGVARATNTLTVDGTVTVKGELSLASLEGKDGGKIIFGAKATTTNTFVDVKGQTVKAVAGLTFTYAKGAFTCPEIKVTVNAYFVTDEKSAKLAGVEDFTDWDQYADVVAKQPWLVVTVDGNVVATFEDVSFTMGDTKVTASYVKDDKAFTTMSVVAVKPWVEGHTDTDNQDYLNNDSESGAKLGDMLNGEWTVTVTLGEAEHTATVTVDGVENISTPVEE